MQGSSSPEHPGMCTAASHEVAYLTHEHLPANPTAGARDPNAQNPGLQVAGKDEAGAGTEGPNKVPAGVTVAREGPPGHEVAGGAESLLPTPPRPPTARPPKQLPETPCLPVMPTRRVAGEAGSTDLHGTLEVRETPAARRVPGLGSSSAALGSASGVSGSGACGSVQLTPCCNNHARMPTLSPDGTQHWQQSPAVLGAACGSASGTQGGHRRVPVPRAQDVTPVSRLRLPEIEVVGQGAEDGQSSEDASATQHLPQLAKEDMHEQSF